VVAVSLVLAAEERAAAAMREGGAGP
jgi:hypothetical protein